MQHEFEIGVKCRVVINSPPCGDIPAAGLRMLEVINGSRPACVRVNIRRQFGYSHSIYARNAQVILRRALEPLVNWRTTPCATLILRYQVHVRYKTAVLRGSQQVAGLAVLCFIAMHCPLKTVNYKHLPISFCRAPHCKGGHYPKSQLLPLCKWDRRAAVGKDPWSSTIPL